MQQKSDTIRPKIPNRPQKSGEKAEEQHRSAGRAQQDIQPQLPFGEPQRKEEKTDRRTETKENVQHTGQLGLAQSQRPQQIVKKSRRQPQKNRLNKDHQLIRDEIPHRSAKQAVPKPAFPLERLLIGN